MKKLISIVLFILSFALFDNLLAPRGVVSIVGSTLVSLAILSISSVIAKEDKNL